MHFIFVILTGFFINYLTFKHNKPKRIITRHREAIKVQLSLVRMDIYSYFQREVLLRETKPRKFIKWKFQLFN